MKKIIIILILGYFTQFNIIKSSESKENFDKKAKKIFRELKLDPEIAIEKAILEWINSNQEIATQEFCNKIVLWMSVCLGARGNNDPALTKNKFDDVYNEYKKMYKEIFGIAKECGIKVSNERVVIFKTFYDLNRDKY